MNEKIDGYDAFYSLFAHLYIVNCYLFIFVIKSLYPRKLENEEETRENPTPTVSNLLFVLSDNASKRVPNLRKNDADGREFV